MATHHEQGHGAAVPHGLPGHDHAGHHHSVLGDRIPAYVGLIAGAAFIFVVLFGVVKWTNGRFAGHGAEKPAAAAAAK